MAKQKAQRVIINLDNDHTSEAIDGLKATLADEKIDYIDDTENLDLVFNFPLNDVEGSERVRQIADDHGFSFGYLPEVTL